MEDSMNTVTGLTVSAETLLRRLGVSELPIKIGETHFFVTKASDPSVTDNELFSFAGKEFKVGEKRKEAV
jgi:hypothetical protein